MEHATIRITRSTVSNGRDCSTQAPILKTSSPKKTKCNTCDVTVCDYENEIKQEQKSNRLKASKSNQNPPSGYGIPSQTTEFQVPPNTNQMPFNQARFSCPCPDYQAPGNAPTDDELWDLQFCRWWGWNWIRKREEMMNKKPCESAPKKNCSCQINQAKEKHVHKHPRKKRDIFNWCGKTFGYKKKRPPIDVEERQRLNDLYDTPSCSTNECICPVNDWECRSLDFKGEYSCYCNSTGKTTSMSTIVIKQHKCRKKENLKKSRSVICEKMDSTTSEECYVPCKSSTGESSDYVNLHLKCVKSLCKDKIPCECGFKRNRNVCPCKVQMCEEPKYVCCEPVCRQRKKKSSPFICLPSRKPPLPCKPIPLLCRNEVQRQPPCCVPKLCNHPPCKYHFPKYIKRCPQQNFGCIIPKKKYVICSRQKCKKPKKCNRNEAACCCCCCCNCKNQLKLVDQANKCEGTSQAFFGTGKQNDSSDSEYNKPRKIINPETQMSVSTSLQHGKYVSPLSGRNYALNPKIVTVSPVVTKSKMPAPFDTNDEAFSKCAAISAGDWEHTKLLQAVCDAIMASRSSNEYSTTLPNDPMNWSSPGKLPRTIGDSKLIEEKQKYTDPTIASFKNNSFLNSLLDTLDDKYFNNLEKNFPTFTPLAPLPEEESVDSCVSNETSQKKSAEGSNTDFKTNDEPGLSTLSRSLIPFNSPRAWLTAPKLPSISVTGLFSSVSKKPPPKSSPNKNSNVYDVLFSSTEPYFEPSESEMFSPESHRLLFREIPRSDVTETTQTSSFLFNPIKVLQNEKDVKSKKSKIPVLVHREKDGSSQVSPRSAQFDLGKNDEGGILEEEDEREFSSEFLENKCSSVMSNMQSNIPVFNLPKSTDTGTSFSKLITEVAKNASSKAILQSLKSLDCNSSSFSAAEGTSSGLFGNDVPIPTTSLYAKPSSLKMKHTKLRSKENFLVGEDVKMAKCMKRESPFSMFCKPVKSSSFVNLLPMSTKRSLLSRPEKRIFIKRSDRVQQ